MGMTNSRGQMSPVSKQTLLRLPVYIHYLKARLKEGRVRISATTIAGDLKLNQIQVRKDLALVSSGGRPKVGYDAKELLADLEHFLGYDNVSCAVLVGAGKLGKAMLAYEGFRSYGLDILAGFDNDPAVVGCEIVGKPILALDKLIELCPRLNVHIGVITTPAESAQRVCDLMVDSGILAVWNFAPVHLKVPDHILVQNENIAASLALLAKHLAEKLGEES
jgi:redox-sensing transcriptional repressor